MERLIERIEALKKSEISKKIDERMKQFRDLGNETKDEIFKEMCFCFLTANYSADNGMRIQNKIDNGFLTLPETDLAAELKTLGHRFPKTRAGYIVGARENDIESMLSGNEQTIRDRIVSNVKGLGYKEASHFLRNIGFRDLAIIDFHIVDLLVKHGLIERPKTLTKNKYMEIENILRELSKKTNLSLGELDLYLWFMETGKILK